MTRKKPSPADLLANARKAQVRSQCRTCALEPKVRAAAEEAFRLKLESFPDVSWGTFTKEVLKPLEYPYGWEPLKKHMERCLDK